MRKSGPRATTRPIPRVGRGEKPYSAISQSIKWNVAVSTATSSGRLALTAIRASGFSIRIHGIFLPFTSSSLTLTVAFVSAAVPCVNSVSPLRCVDVAEVEEGPPEVVDRQVNAVAGGDVADVEIAAPFALAVETRRDLAVGGDAKRADERGDRPGDLAVEMEGAVAGSAGGTGRVLEDLGGVIAGQFRPARRFAERAAAWADGDPGVVVDGDRFEA